MLDYALKYASVGFPVFPVFPNKKPRTQHGFHDATKDPDTIRKWWEMWPDAGIGMPTGLTSGVAVLDIDPRHSGDSTLADLEQKNGRLPDTKVVLTGGGGTHYWFKITSPVPSRNAIAEGVDWKAEGGYVVIPPSPHESGGRYEWEISSKEAQLIEPPAWVLALLPGGLVPVAPATQSRTRAEPLGPQIGAGKRNIELMRLAGSMRAKGCGASEIFAALREVNAQRCQPPMDEREVWSIAQSAASYLVENRRSSSQEEAGVRGQFAGSVVNLASLIQEEVPPIQWLVDRVIVQESVGWIGGMPKIGKSLIGLHMCLCVATGVPFLGQYEVTKGRALYISEEDPKRIVYPRVKRMLAGFPPTTEPVDPDSFHLMCKNGLRIDRVDHMAWLHGRVEKQKPSLIVADVFNRLHDQDVNKAEEMRAIVVELDKLRATHKCTVLCVIHFKKIQSDQDTSNPGQLISGSLALHAFSECSIYMMREDEKKRLYFEAKEFEATKPVEMHIISSEDDENSPIVLECSEVNDTTEVGRRNREIAQSSLQEAWEKSGRPQFGVATAAVMKEAEKRGVKYGVKTLIRHLRGGGLVPRQMPVRSGETGGVSMLWKPQNDE